MTKNTDDINISDIPKAAPVDVVAKLFDELITPICNNCDAEWVVPCRCKGFPKLCMKLDLTLTGVVAVLAANNCGVAYKHGLKSRHTLTSKEGTIE